MKSLSPRSLAIRFLGISFIIFAGWWILAQPIAEARLQREVKATLFAVQQGLQNYHVAEELYPVQAMSGYDLVRQLQQREFLSTPLRNPWTGEEWTDREQPDWLLYETDQFAETYRLVAFWPDTEKVQYELDSVENPSLE
ncbi:MAG: hypothetical protein AAF236_17625 [Verrucomicrobiota bacterium]